MVRRRRRPGGTDALHGALRVPLRFGAQPFLQPVQPASGVHPRALSVGGGLLRLDRARGPAHPALRARRVRERTLPHPARGLSRGRPAALSLHRRNPRRNSLSPAPVLHLDCLHVRAEPTGHHPLLRGNPRGGLSRRTADYRQRLAAGLRGVAVSPAALRRPRRDGRAHPRTGVCHLALGGALRVGGQSGVRRARFPRAVGARARRRALHLPLVGRILGGARFDQSRGRALVRAAAAIAQGALRRARLQDGRRRRPAVRRAQRDQPAHHSQRPQRTVRHAGRELRAQRDPRLLQVRRPAHRPAHRRPAAPVDGGARPARAHSPGHPAGHRGLSLSVPGHDRRRHVHRLSRRQRAGCRADCALLPGGGADADDAVQLSGLEPGTAGPRHLPGVLRAAHGLRRLHRRIGQARGRDGGTHPARHELPISDFGPVDDQFLLGERVLVAPVLHKGRTSRVVRLPAGTWKYPPTGERFTAEVAREVIVAAPLEVLPYFEREEEA